MPDAGWYVDPSGQRRWWDGAKWTDAVLATFPLNDSPKGSLYDADKDRVAGKNSAATQGMITGISAMVLLFIPALSWLAFIGGIAAIVWSAIGLKRSPIGHGKAITGMILGIVATALWIATLATTLSALS